MTWIVRNECWLPKSFGDQKKDGCIVENRLDFLTVGHTLDYNGLLLRRLPPSVHELWVVMHPVCEYHCIIVSSRAGIALV